MVSPAESFKYPTRESSILIELKNLSASPPVVTLGFPYPEMFFLIWFVKTAIVPVLLTNPFIFLIAWDMSLAMPPIWASPI